MVSTPLKNISQNGNLPYNRGDNIKNIWNHHLVFFSYSIIFSLVPKGAGNPQKPTQFREKSHLCNRPQGTFFTQQNSGVVAKPSEQEIFSTKWPPFFVGGKWNRSFYWKYWIFSNFRPGGLMEFKSSHQTTGVVAPGWFCVQSSFPGPVMGVVEPSISIFPSGLATLMLETTAWVSDGVTNLAFAILWSRLRVKIELKNCQCLLLITISCICI